MSEALFSKKEIARYFLACYKEKYNDRRIPTERFNLDMYLLYGYWGATCEIIKEALSDKPDVNLPDIFDKELFPNAYFQKFGDNIAETELLGWFIRLGDGAYERIEKRPLSGNDELNTWIDSLINHVLYDIDRGEDNGARIDSIAPWVTNDTRAADTAYIIEFCKGELLRAIYQKHKGEDDHDQRQTL